MGERVFLLDDPAGQLGFAGIFGSVCLDELQQDVADSELQGLVFWGVAFSQYMEAEDIRGDPGGHGFLGNGAGGCQKEEGGQKEKGESVEWGKMGRVFFHMALRFLSLIFLGISIYFHICYTVYALRGRMIEKE